MSPFVEGGQNIKSLKTLYDQDCASITDDFFSGGAYSSTVKGHQDFYKENPNEGNNRRHSWF